MITMTKRNVCIALIMLIGLCSLSSCWFAEPIDDGPEVSNAWVYNHTSDTLMLSTHSYTMWHDTDTLVLPPYDTTLITTYDCPVEEPYDSFWGWMALRDTSKLYPIWVYKDSVIIIQWNPPCREMGDTHSWYNKKSWSVVKQGWLNRMRRSTFTITEADYGHFF